MAMAARRFIVGKLPKKVLLTSMAAFIWGASRFALLIATVTVLVCWLALLPLGLLVETAFLRAGVLLVVVTAFNGIIGDAIFNSILVVRQWRRGRAE